MKITHYPYSAALFSLGTCLILSPTAEAGPDSPPLVQETSHHNGDWCEWLSSSPGKLYSNKENPFIQEVKFFGRSHVQYSYTDVDGIGGDFSDDIFDFRRLRVGTQIKFLNYFKFKSAINLVSDSRDVGDSRDFEYNSIENATLTFDLAKAFDLDINTFEIFTGKNKAKVGHEQHISANSIKTVERSAISGRATAGNLTGFGVVFGTENWKTKVAYYSDIDDDEFDYFDDSQGELFYITSKYTLENKDFIIADFASSFGSGTAAEYDWVTALSYSGKRGAFEFGISAFLGDNRASGDRGGNFYGVSILPTYWLVNDTLEVVARYQYQGSDEDEGIRLNSRSVRDAAGNNLGADINGGFGDSHHSFYLGLNYYLCGDNFKFLTGIEYDKLDTPRGDVDALTYSAAFRVKF